MGIGACSSCHTRHTHTPTHATPRTQKTATAVAHCKRGSGLLKVNGTPIALVQPEILRTKVIEPILILGQERFADLDIRIRVSGGGQVSQIYAIRQALAKAVVAFYQKFVDEAAKKVGLAAYVCVPCFAACSAEATRCAICRSC